MPRDRSSWMVENYGKSSEIWRWQKKIECTAAIEGVQTWSLCLWTPPPPKRSSGMCGFLHQVWAGKLPTSEVQMKKWAKRWHPEMYAFWTSYGFWIILNLWLKTREGPSMCMEPLSLSILTDLRWTWDSYTVRSCAMWHANIESYGFMGQEAKECKRNWPASDLTIRWFVPISLRTSAIATSSKTIKRCFSLQHGPSFS